MQPLTRFRFLLTVLVAVLFLAGPFGAAGEAHAKKKKEDPGKAGDAAKKDEKKDEDSPFKEWDKTLKDSEAKSGFFTIHRKHENVWMEVKPDQLDKTFLMVSSLSSGLGRGWLLGGMPLDTDLWALHRAGNRVQFLVRNSRFRAAPDSPMAKAVALSYADSVLASPKIVSVHKESGNLLVDLNEVLISDLPGISLALKQFLGGPATFDKDRTAVSSIKVFPKNLEIEVAAVYGSPEGKPLETVPDSRYLPIGIHYSLSELPEEPYTPRLADDRVGYFMTVVKDFSRDEADTFFVRFANRWKLEKQDPAAAISPPKEPIVYYLDATIPVEYRTFVRDGLLMWNKAFEKAGFKDAIVVKDPPEDPDFDPEDVRYNTIRWITSTEPSFGAIGPSRVDPRSGHILDADILVEAAMIQNIRRGYRNYVASLTAPSASSASPFGEGDRRAPSVQEWVRALGERPEALCSFADAAAMSATVDAALFQMTGEMLPGGEVPEAYIGEYLRWVTAHEVGHTLGLRHNFRASAATPAEKLHDTAWTRDRGLYNSVMEYPPANITIDRARQGDYYSHTAGTYDIWAIQYGYTPFGATDPEAERPSLMRIAEQSTKPGLEYGADEDAFAGPIPVGVDPDVSQFDLGSDPVAFGRDRLALIRAVRGKIHESLTAPSEGYDRLRNTFEGLIAAQGMNLQIISKQIGGLRTSRAHRGDPGERPAFAPVPADRQRDAMRIVLESGLSDQGWEVEPELLASLQPNHHWHWGMDLSKSIPWDFPYTRRVAEIQSALLDRLMHPVLLSRILETEARANGGEAYTLAEHLRSLTDGVFFELSSKGTPAGPYRISVMRRSLGRETLDRTIAILNRPPEGTPEDARSLSRSNLVGLEKKMGAVLSSRGAGMDEATKAYLEDSRARIRRALEAQAIVTG